MGIGVELGVVAAVLAVSWLLLDWRTQQVRAARLGRWLGVVEDAPDAPSGPPLEQVAADAERIRSAIRQAPPGVPLARLRGWRQAYDDVLAVACLELGLEQDLQTRPEGVERDLERERVERMLVRAGLLT